MKDTNQSEPINFIPDGVWEASKPKKKNDVCTPTTDLQGNGYPNVQHKKASTNKH